MSNRIPQDVILPWTAMTLDEARRQVDARHFVKEALPAAERELLHITEGLLRLVDPAAYGVDHLERSNGERIS